MISIFKLSANIQAFIELFSVFRTHSRLIYELTKREIFDRYTGQVFGAVWSLIHPLLLTFIYIFVFGFVFKARVGDSLSMPLDYTSYMLSGFIPWIVFSEVIGKSSTVITTNANIVKQVVFPIEVLPIKNVLASFITQGVFLIIFLIYVLATNHTLAWTYLLIPILFLLQTITLIGLSYLFSAIGVYFRDIKDFVQIFLSVAFFILPILYLPESIPSAVRPILYFNPISYMIWCYQDTLYFGSFMHPWAWFVFGFGSVFIFVLGYRVFRKLKVMFGNVL
ncbi:MAG: ABC transporter permease [Bacteroidales bacterium]|nr:ABC transporter permease [Bacteroidales bacterium]